MALQSWLKVALLFLLWLGAAYTADYTKSECFDPSEPNKQGTIVITCPENSVISIDDAIFGTNEWGVCIITEDDCTEQTKIFQVCDGQVNCTRTFKTFTRTCGYSTMLVLGYSCIRSFTDPPATPSTDTPVTVSHSWSSDDTIKPRQFPTNKPNQPGYPGSKSDSKDMEEIGLIIGCALTAFITVVFLIIAIVMVIRRLLQNDEKEGRDHASRSSGDCGSVCIKLDCLPCVSRTETTRKNSHDLRMRKKLDGSHSDESKLRVAPIGEESIADPCSILSESQDSISSGSIPGVEEKLSFQPHQQHGKMTPKKPHGEMQQYSQGGNAQKETWNQEERNKKGKFKACSSNPASSSRQDQDNENTLPSSSNKNLVLLQNETFFSEENNPTQVKNISSPSQHTFDAIAIPNTLGGSAC